MTTTTNTTTSATTTSTTTMHSGANNLNNDLYKARNVIFMIGGSSYNELRSIYEINNEYNDVDSILLLGTSKLLKPNDFVRQLANLNQKEYNLELKKDLQVTTHLEKKTNIDDIELDLSYNSESD